MYRKREREFQYPPGIEKIIEDVIGGGTIDRRDLQNALFNGKSLDELPPIVIVVKDRSGNGAVSCIEDGDGFRSGRCRCDSV